jgi:hypothetical protein
VEFSFRTVSKLYLQTAVNQNVNSVPSNKIILDNSFIEYAIISLFHIDIMNYIKVKAAFAKNFHIPPSELDSMPAWEYDLFITEINKMIKEENEQHKKEMDNPIYKDTKKMANPAYAQKMANKYTGNIKTPKLPKY